MPNKAELEDAREFAQKQRKSLAQTALDFFENEFAVAKTLSGIAETRYSIGHTELAERSKHEALKAIRTVRHFLEKPHLLTPETISAFAKRCDELEFLVNRVTRRK